MYAVQGLDKSELVHGETEWKRMNRESVVVMNGTLEGTTLDLDGSLLIGRNPDSGLQLDDLQVSRRHAVIEQTPNGTFVRDQGSGNGTYVGGRRVLECRLNHGDVVTVGSIDLRFESIGDAERSGVSFDSAVEGQLEASKASRVYETFFQAPDLAATLEEQRDAQRRLAAVYQANQIIASERDLRKLFERVMDQIFSLVPAHNGVILLRDERTDELVTEFIKSGDGNVVISSTIVNRARNNGEAVVTRDAAGDSRFRTGASIIQQNITSAMAAPLMHQDETLGVLYVDTRGTTNAFKKGDLELLVALSGPAAIAIKNAQYVHQLERAYHDTLIVIANAVEMRDHYTVGHTWRVTNFGLAIAAELGWDEEQLDICETGGVLHDVGKIAVDDAILRKPGRLTDEEYAKMKIHPERGARMLEDVEFLKPMIPYCLYHHERYDGKGYPFGLAGEDIPIEGRLTAVADTFDAMTSNRPYRKGLDPEIAIEEIEKGKGTQFDPMVADALISCYRKGAISGIIQDSLKGGKSIACPFCSTFISISDSAKVDDVIQCAVCHRRMRLKEKNQAFYGELFSEAEVVD